jgi:hypothetical protein
MQVLTDIFKLLKEYNYVADQADFSRKFLGRSEGYYAYIKSSKAPICLVSLSLLAAALHSVAAEVDESREFVKRQRLRSAWVGALMMLEGEREIAFADPADWVTAQGVIPALTWPPRT